MPEIALAECDNVSAALAREADDVDVRPDVAREHPRLRALAHAAAGEDADALALAESQQTIDAPHAGFHGLADARAGQRIVRLQLQIGGFAPSMQRLAVERPAERIDDPAEEPIADRHCEWP